jgi:hypothetical protein
LHQVFFVVVNGGTGIDARRIFTQFLISMSWAKINILRIWSFSIISILKCRGYIQSLEVIVMQQKEIKHVINHITNKLRVTLCRRNTYEIGVNFLCNQAIWYMLVMTLTINKIKCTMCIWNKFPMQLRKLLSTMTFTKSRELSFLYQNKFVTLELIKG